MIVADSDVLIDALAGREPSAGRVALEIEMGELHTTAVNRFELLSGARDARQEAAIRKLLDALAVLPLGTREADRAAEVRRDLDKRGEGIGMGDSLIAGIALTHGAILLTRNRRHFERVAGLTLGRLTASEG